jgi:putative GTP pyrophosphokinase
MCSAPEAEEWIDMSLSQKEIVAEYENKRTLFIGFTKKLKRLIRDLLETDGIKYHLIEGRTKSVESFEEKAFKRGKHYDDPIREITDLSGIRIIVYYSDDVEKVANLIKSEFMVDWENSVDKGLLLKPNEFGYRSVHYVVSLSRARQEMFLPS